MLGNKSVIDIYTPMVGSGFRSHEVPFLRPAFRDNDLPLIVNPSHVVVNLAADENVVVGGRDWTF
jgi:hypothetical protein